MQRLPEATPKPVALKLGRARQHLNALHAAVNAWQRVNLDRVTVQQEADGKRWTWTLGDVEPIPDEIGLIFGECLFALRSTLDHLVYQLHERLLAPNDFTDQIKRGSAFPIFSNEADFRSRGAWRIERLPPAVRTLVEELQPYRALDIKFPIEDAIINGHSETLISDSLSGLLGDLRILNELHNADKHRRLHLVEAGPSGFHPATLLTEGWEITRTDLGEVKAGADLGSVHLAGDGAAPMEVQVAFNLTVVLAEMEHRPEVVTAAFALTEVVATVVSRFSHHFASTPPSTSMG